MEATNAERSERELLLVDRIVVSKGRFAVGDEAKHNVMLKDTETLEKKEAEELQYFLEKRKQELIEDARDAGEPISAAEQLYQFNEQSYIEEFQRASKFE